MQTNIKNSYGKYKHIIEKWLSKKTNWTQVYDKNFNKYILIITRVYKNKQKQVSANKYLSLKLLLELLSSVLEVEQQGTSQQDNSRLITLFNAERHPTVTAMSGVAYLWQAHQGS